MDTAELWTLMDGRALEDVDRAAVLMVGTCAECCEAANAGDFGKGCAVADPGGAVAWHLFATGRWDPEE